MSALPVVTGMQAQAALRHEAARVVDLLRSVRRPAASALGAWTLAEVAMHLSQAYLIVPAMARGDLSPARELLPQHAGAHGESLVGDVWELADMTVLGVGADPERDPRVLADRIEERAATFLEEAASYRDDDRRPWLVEGVTLPMPTFVCHLLNETVVHGYDIARADGRRWTIGAAHAGLVLDGFVWTIVRTLGPRAMVDPEAAAGLKATYDLRTRGAGRYHLTFDDGELDIRAPGPGRVDCHIWADAEALLMVAWARQSQWEAIAKGKLLAWGRKPWLGPRFRTLLRNP